MRNTTASLANQMKHRDREMVPRVLVLAMFGLMAAAVALVGYAQLSDQPLSGVAPDSTIIAERPIRLEGTRSTGVSVLNVSGETIAHSSDDKAGFIDVIWVAINRKRDEHKITGNPAVSLVRRENGHVAIIDPATDWKIELIGYGKDNVAAFAKLID